MVEPENLLEAVESDSVEYEEVEEGVVNETFIVGDYILQVPRYEESFRRSLYLMDTLKRGGAPVPSVEYEGEGPLHAVFERLKGECLSQLKGEDRYQKAIEESGRTLAKLHSVNFTRYGKPDPEQNFKGSHSKWRDFVEEWLEDSLDTVENNHFSEIMEKAAENIDFNNIPEEPKSTVLHLDYTPDNLILQNEEVKAIDFDDSRLGDFRFDLAYATLGLADGDRDRAEAFLRGYSQESDRNYEKFKDLPLSYRAMAVIQSAKAGDWNYRNEKRDSFEEWIEGLQNLISNGFEI